ncbi:MAG: tetratricopeptide repeat protein [Chloroflexota bacterium]|nr:tetratricopeptide repeat protein [Chloroflexota bacterium]
MKLPRFVWTLLLLLVLPALVGVLALIQRSDPVAQLVQQSREHAAAERFDDAIVAMDDALALAPDNPLLYVERGQRILLIYEWDRALADFDRAIEIAPDYADAYYWRGILYASVPDASARPQARADFERYLQLAPNGSYATDAARYVQQLGQ